MSGRVLAAMSGGVDSSVAAAILREQGYDVVGVAMRLAPEASGPARGRRGTCCSYEDFEDARRVAERFQPVLERMFNGFFAPHHRPFGSRSLPRLTSATLPGGA